MRIPSGLTAIDVISPAAFSFAGTGQKGYNLNVIKRRKTKIVKIGSVKIGSSAPVVIQSMTKVPTADVSRCVR